MLLGPSGMMTAGAAIEIRGRHYTIFARLTNLLADGDGLRMILNWMGASGLKPCFVHSNVLAKNHDSMLEDDENGLVDICEADPAKFEVVGDNYMSDMMDLVIAAEDKVRAGEMSQAQFERVEMCAGYHPNREGILANARLRPLCWPKILTQDWVHNCLQDGIMVVEIKLLLHELQARNIASFADIRAYFKSGFGFPSCAQSDNLWRVFDEVRENVYEDSEHGKLKCSSAEAIGIYGILRHFVETRMPSTADLAPYSNSFHLCCSVVDLMLDIKRGSVAIPDAVLELKRRLSAHMTSHIKAYTKAHVKPKHHWMFDVAEQLQRHGACYDMFIIDRLHLRCKRVADKVQNTTTFEASVLSGIVESQRRALQDYDLTSGLRGPTARLSPVLSAADAIDLEGMHLHIDDFVLIQPEREAAKIVACFREDWEGIT